MPKENLHSQFEEDTLVSGNTSPKKTEEGVLRRLVLEILPSLRGWCEKKDSLTRMAVEQTIRNPQNYQAANPEQWQDLLEEFCEKSLELLILKDPLNLGELLLGKKNPLLQRIQELGPKILDENLLVAWHQSHGPIAATFPALEDTNSNFPKIKTLILQSWPLAEEKTPIALWVWDRKNFQT